MQKRSVFNLLIMAPILSGIVLSFQNCSPVNFSTLASESSIDLLGVCEVDPSLPQCSDPEPKSPQKCTFNGKEYSEGETVKAFLSSTVAAGQVCVSEDRRCVNGAFTGSYLYATCAVDAPASCLFNGITVPHGDTIEAFENPSVPYNANCVAEMRRCNNGVLGGTYEHLKCEPVAASFAWASSPQGSCSATPSYNYGAWSACGSNGQQTRTSSCVNTSGTQSRTVVCKDQNGTTVSDSYCASQTKPATSVSCSGSCSGTPVTVQSCTPATWSWSASSYGSCSATPSYSYGAWSACGSNGQQTRTSSCVNTSGTQSRTVVCKDQSGATVADSFCANQTKPATSISCNGSCSGTPVTVQSCTPATWSWSASSYGSCSATPSYNYGAWSACGSNGQQTRTSSCVNTSGTQSRTVVCKDQSGAIVADSFCASQTKPATSVSCNGSCSGTPVSVQSCTPTYTYSWDSSSIVNSGSCSAIACGTTGIQNRVYTVCRRNDGVSVATSYCGSNTAPAVSCSAQACPTVACAAGSISVTSAGNNAGTTNTCAFSWPSVNYGTGAQTFYGSNGGILRGTCGSNGEWTGVTSTCPAPADVSRQYVYCRDIGGDLSNTQDLVVWSYVPGTIRFNTSTGSGGPVIYYAPGTLQSHPASCYSGG